MQIIMPKLGLTMTHGTITEWLKAPGDTAEAEEALCAYETEKVTLELVAPADGVLVEILAPVGTTVPAGAPVCEFLTASDLPWRLKVEGSKFNGATFNLQQPSTLRQAQGRLLNLEPVTYRGLATPKARALARQLNVDLSTVPGSGPAGRIQAADVMVLAAGSPRPAPAEIKATPLARRIAAAEGVDLRSISGSGPEGTITREDVEQAVRGQGTGWQGTQGRGDAETRGREGGGAGPTGQPPVGGETAPLQSSSVQPLTSLRRTIAERMTQSAFTAPHVTLFTEAEATNLVSARAQLNAELTLPPAAAGGAGGGAKISYNTLLAALVARALREHPNVNARWDADGIHLLAEVNIALAVDTERGLMTPVLRRVDTLSLSAIQRGYTELTDRALAGKSLPDDFTDGTFTITNLGALDVDGFTPIINPPQAAILGVGRIIEKPVARDGAVVIRPMITLSLSFDHRVVDGAPAARFLQRVKQLVERPMALLLRDAAIHNRAIFDRAIFDRT